MRKMIATVLLIAAGSASAADGPAEYGSPAGCALLGSHAGTGDEVLDDAGPYYLGDDTLYGADYACDVLTGACESEGHDWSMPIMVTRRPEAAEITIESETFILPRCR